MHLALGVGLLLATLITFFAYRAIRRAQIRLELLQRFGCQKIVTYPYREPWGRDYDRMIRQSFRDGRVNRVKMQVYKTCGSSTYETRTLNERMISTADPENHRCIATNVDDWKKDVRPGSFPFFGVNLLDQNGPTWKHMRGLVNPLFQRAELKELEFFGKFVDRMIDLIPRDGATVDLQPLIRKLCLDSSTEFVFGESIDSLTDTTGRATEFLAAFNRAATGVGKRIRPTGIKLTFNRIFSTWDTQWLADCKVIHDYIDGCIARHRDRSATKNPGKRYVLIEGMFHAIPDPVALRFQLLGIFHIARETAAMGLTNVLFVLARNPRVWAELRALALALAPIGEEITYDRLHACSAFRYTVLEAFRLHNPIARSRRVAVRDTVLPRGGGPDGSHPCLVPKGMTVWADRFPLTRDPSIWGEDVEEFRPSRFEGKRFGWEFQPFGGGARTCPASQKTISQCVYFLYRLVREFEMIENRDPCEEFVEGVVICFTSRNGCKVALHPALPSVK